MSSDWLYWHFHLTNEKSHTDHTSIAIHLSLMQYYFTVVLFPPFPCHDKTHEFVPNQVLELMEATYHSFQYPECECSSTGTGYCLDC